MNGSEKMEHEGEKPETLAKWAELDTKPNDKKYISPEYDKSYRVTLSSVTLARKAFKEGEKPKLKAVCVIKTLNGQPSGQTWETGSFSVMRELKKHIVGEEWKGSEVVYLLKKKKEGDKTTYVFEELGSVEAML
jgi:hypothetical protein